MAIAGVAAAGAPTVTPAMPRVQGAKASLCHLPLLALFASLWRYLALFSFAVSSELQLVEPVAKKTGFARFSIILLVDALNFNIFEVIW